MDLFGNSLQLFQSSGGKFIQNTTMNQFGTIINDVKGLTTTLGVNDDKKIESLAKDIYGIYEEKVKDYNELPPGESYDATWTTPSELIRKYQSITGLKLSGTDSTDIIRNNIRKPSKAKAVLEYYEYMQFKKADFECTDVRYDDNNSGRIIGMDFQYTGRIE